MPTARNSLEEAIHQTCHNFQGGIKTLAEELSLAQGTLYNKCNPAMTSHCFNLSEALKIMRLCQDYAILQVLSREAHHACIPKTSFQNLGDMALFDTWMAGDIELGKTAASIREAFADQRIDAAELRTIRSEMFTDFACELELLDRLRQYADDDGPDAVAPLPSLVEAARLTVQGYPAGISQLAAELGMRETELRKKTDTEQSESTFSLRQALTLMRLTNDYTILHTLAGHLSHACIAIPRYQGVNHMELLDAWSSWGVERGDTVALIHAALEDGKIDTDEFARIEQEMFKDFNKELALLARLQVMIS